MSKLYRIIPLPNLEWGIQTNTGWFGGWKNLSREIGNYDCSILACLTFKSEVSAEQYIDDLIEKEKRTAGHMAVKPRIYP